MTNIGFDFRERGYEVVKPIGSGQFGRALLVRQIADGALRTAKTVDLTILEHADASVVGEEAKLLHSVGDHPSIVNFYESFIYQDTYLVIIMEYCQGGDMGRCLAALRVTGKAFPEEEILGMLRQLLQALRTIHERFILHRDLKPSNILLASDGSLKIADFGVSRRISHTAPKAKTSVGTPQYMPPEMMLGKTYTYKSDMWALGCVIYEMMALRPAFQAETPLHLAFRVCFGIPPQLPETYSPGLRSAVMALLTKKPDQRPSVDEILSSELYRDNPFLLTPICTQNRLTTLREDEDDGKTEQTTLDESAADSPSTTPGAAAEASSPPRRDSLPVLAPRKGSLRPARPSTCSGSTNSSPSLPSPFPSPLEEDQTGIDVRDDLLEVPKWIAPAEDQADSISSSPIGESTVLPITTTCSKSVNLAPLQSRIVEGEILIRRLHHQLTVKDAKIAELLLRTNSTWTHLIGDVKNLVFLMTTGSETAQSAEGVAGSSPAALQAPWNLSRGYTNQSCEKSDASWLNPDEEQFSEFEPVLVDVMLKELHRSPTPESTIRVRNSSDHALAICPSFERDANMTTLDKIHEDRMTLMWLKNAVETYELGLATFECELLLDIIQTVARKNSLTLRDFLHYARPNQLTSGDKVLQQKIEEVIGEAREVIIGCQDPHRDELERALETISMADPQGNRVIPTERFLDVAKGLGIRNGKEIAHCAFKHDSGSIQWKNLVLFLTDYNPPWDSRLRPTPCFPIEPLNKEEGNAAGELQPPAPEMPDNPHVIIGSSHPRFPHPGQLPSSRDSDLCPTAVEGDDEESPGRHKPRTRNPRRGRPRRAKECHQFALPDGLDSANTPTADILPSDIWAAMARSGSSSDSGSVSPSLTGVYDPGALFDLIMRPRPRQDNHHSAGSALTAVSSAERDGLLTCSGADGQVTKSSSKLISRPPAINSGAHQENQSPSTTPGHHEGSAGDLSDESLSERPYFCGRFHLREPTNSERRECYRRRSLLGMSENSSIPSFDPPFEHRSASQLVTNPRPGVCSQPSMGLRSTSLLGYAPRMMRRGKLKERTRTDVLRPLSNEELLRCLEDGNGPWEPHSREAPMMVLVPQFPWDVFSREGCDPVRASSTVRGAPRPVLGSTDPGAEDAVLPGRIRSRTASTGRRGPVRRPNANDAADRDLTKPECTPRILADFLALMANDFVEAMNFLVRVPQLRTVSVRHLFHELTTNIESTSGGVKYALGCLGKFALPVRAADRSLRKDFEKIEMLGNHWLNVFYHARKHTDEIYEAYCTYQPKRSAPEIIDTVFEQLEALATATANILRQSWGETAGILARLGHDVDELQEMETAMKQISAKILTASGKRWQELESTYRMLKESMKEGLPRGALAELARPHSWGTHLLPSERNPGDDRNPLGRRMASASTFQGMTAATDRSLLPLVSDLEEAVDYSGLKQKHPSLRSRAPRALDCGRMWSQGEQLVSAVTTCSSRRLPYSSANSSGKSLFVVNPHEESWRDILSVSGHRPFQSGITSTSEDDGLFCDENETDDGDYAPCMLHGIPNLISLEPEISLQRHQTVPTLSSARNSHSLFDEASSHRGSRKPQWSGIQENLTESYFRDPPASARGPRSPKWTSPTPTLPMRNESAVDYSYREYKGRPEYHLRTPARLFSTTGGSSMGGQDKRTAVVSGMAAIGPTTRQQSSRKYPRQLSPNRHSYHLDTPAAGLDPEYNFCDLPEDQEASPDPYDWSIPGKLQHAQVHGSYSSSTPGGGAARVRQQAHAF